MVDLYIKVFINIIIFFVGGKENINVLFWCFDYFFSYYVLLYFN